VGKPFGRWVSWQGSDDLSNVLRNVPSVNELLDSPPLKSLMSRLSRNVVVSRVGRFLDGMRGQVQSAATALHVPSPADLAQRIADWIAAEEQPEVRPVINATGIFLHPELGGPPLAAEAIQAMVSVAGNYAGLEAGESASEQGSQSEAAERLLIGVTGAEAALVTSSQSGAAILALAALAAGREVLVSRGQIVDVPGRQRLPDVVLASGAVLREVGTINCTRIGDYAAAAGERSAALWYVPARAAAGAEQPSLAELATLAHRQKAPLIADLSGGGALVDLSAYGVADEPTVGQILQMGADLVIFSGDRLLGGPACGLIAGRQESIEQISRHLLMPALRPGKLTLAALAATLRLYRDQRQADRSVPLLSLLSTPLDNLKNRAERLAPQLAATGIAQVEIVKSEALLAPGIGPSRAIASYALALTPSSGSAQSLAAALRAGKSSVVGRVENARFLIDLRTVLPRQDVELVGAVEEQAPPKPPAEPPANQVPAMD
jgi:L-seryl-tRNA(Ser) seleniumtransferase